MSTLTMTTPERSLQQRLDALKHANEIRLARAQLKRDLKVRCVSAADILAAPPEWAETMKVIDLLIAIPKVGRVKANKWLKLAEASPSKTLGGISGRQRTELVRILRGRR